MSQANESKLLTELRVIDLRNALELRNLDKSGVKATLVERLRDALVSEDLDPETYRFDVAAVAVTDRKSVGRSRQAGDDADSSFQEHDSMDSGNLSASMEKADGGEDEDSVQMEDFNVVDEEEDAAAPPEKVGHAELPPPPDPEDVPPRCPFTVDETVKMHAAAHPPRVSTVDTDSLFVNADDSTASLNELAAPHAAAGAVGLTPSHTDEHKQEETAAADEHDAAERQLMEVEELLLAEGDHQPLEEEDGDDATSEDILRDDSATATADTEHDEHLIEEHDDDHGEGVAKDGGDAATGEMAEETTAAAAAPESTVEETEESETAANGGEKAETKSDDGKAAQEVKARKVAATTNARHLWVSGLSTSTRATDLKTLFTKYGRVTAAKIMTSTKAPGSKCFGFVAMSQPDEASKCIQHLHRTELKGKMISVERTKGEMFPSAGGDKTADGKKVSTVKNGQKDDKGSDGKSDRAERSKSHTSTDSKHRRSSSQSRKRVITSDHSSRPPRDAASSRRPIIVRGGRGSYVPRGGVRQIGAPPYHPTSRYPPVRGGGYYRGGITVNGRGATVGMTRIAPPTSTRGGPMFNQRRTLVGPPHAAAAMAPPPDYGGFYRRGRADDPRMSQQMRPEPFDRRELEREMRRKEEEFQQREERLRLEREKERLKAEREKIEREKLELQQLRLSQQLMVQQQQMAAAGVGGYGAGGGAATYGAAGGGYAMQQQPTQYDRRGGYDAPPAATAYGQHASRDMRHPPPGADDSRRSGRGGSPRASRDIRGGRDDRRMGSGGDSLRKDVGGVSGGGRRPAGELPRAYDTTSSRYGGAPVDAKKDRAPYASSARADYIAPGRDSTGYGGSRGGGAAATSSLPRSYARSDDDRRGRSSTGGGLLGSGYTAATGVSASANYPSSYAQQQHSGARVSSGGYAPASGGGGSASNMWQTTGGTGGSGGSWGAMQGGGGGYNSASSGATGDRFDAYKYSGGGGATSRRY